MTYWQRNTTIHLNMRILWNNKNIGKNFWNQFFLIKKETVNTTQLLQSLNVNIQTKEAKKVLLNPNTTR